MKITAYGKQIMVEPVKNKQILVSDTNTLCEYGEVKSVGEDVVSIKVGETIGFLPWGLNHLEVEGTRYYFVPESSDFILGRIENE